MNTTRNISQVVGDVHSMV